MKILITGSSGFIGYRIFNFLKKKKINITEISRSKKSSNTNLKLDLTRFKKTNKKFDVLIHCAANTPPKYNNREIKKNYLINHNIFKIAKETGIKKIIYLSSMSIYKKNKKKIYENSQKTSKDVYGKTKLHGEKIFLNNKKLFDQIFILRLPSVVGKGCHSTFLSKIAQSVILKKEKIIVYNKKSYFNNCIYVNDLCKKILLILKNNQLKILIENLKSKNPILISTVIEIFREQFDYQNTIEFKDGNSKSFLIENINKRYLGNLRTTKNTIIKYIKELKQN